MCCDIHPTYPYLLVIGKLHSIIYGEWTEPTENILFEYTGMFDGNVAVYNLQSNFSQPMYISRETDGKHSNIVWEVKWGVDMQDGELNFYSISADGMVYNWLLMQSQLSLTTITALFIDQEISAGPDGSNVKLKGTK